MLIVITMAMNTRCEAVESRQEKCFSNRRAKDLFFNPDRPMEVQDSPAKVFSGLTFALVAGAGMVAFGIAALVLDWDL
jgi:hypothetical protein